MKSTGSASPQAVAPQAVARKVEEREAVSVEEIEERLLLDGIHSRYGFDFRDYAPETIRRILRKRRIAEKCVTLSALQDRMLRDPACLERMLGDICDRSTGMFRPPPFYRAFREKVVPLLRTYPFVRIWNAGCASGEELYSVAITLEEEDLYDRARIYATDLCDSGVRQAEEGVYDRGEMTETAALHQQAGGKRALSHYYRTKRHQAFMRPELRRNVVFSRHNLAIDGPFNEFNVILCRNVLSGFNASLRDRVLRLFRSSLCRFGVLGLGAKEDLQGTGIAKDFEPLDATRRIYRRVR